MAFQPIKEVPLNEIDFEVVKEDFTRYQLVDGTLLKIKICVIKILESIDRGIGDYPTFALCTSNVLNALVPERLKAQPSTPPSTEDKVDEINFATTEEAWQEYKTVDGFLVRVRPVVTKVFKHGKYNVLGEPVYSTPNIQLIQDARRTAS